MSATSEGFLYAQEIRLRRFGAIFAIAGLGCVLFIWRSVMILILYFDIEMDAVYVPDGYVNGIHALQEGFLEWADDQCETFALGPGKLICKQYSCELLLRYINDQVLANCREKSVSY